MKKKSANITILLFIALTLTLSCNKDKDEPVTPSTQVATNNSAPDFLKLGTQTVNVASADIWWQYEYGDDAYYVNTNGALSLATQLTLVDSTGLNSSFQYPFSSKTYTLQPNVQVLPAPTYDKATFELAIPTGSQVWVPTGGTITAVKNANGTFTLTFTNVPVQDNTGTQTSTASGRITCN